MTVEWTVQQVQGLDADTCRTEVFTPPQTVPAIADLYLWDLWPILEPDGNLPLFEGSEHWMALSAPRRLPPPARHDVARIRLLKKLGSGWSDLGPVFPDEASPGSGEWAGSATVDPRTQEVTVRYTAVGERGRPGPSFAQRVFEASSPFVPGGTPAFPAWSDHRELIAQGGDYRSTLDQTTGEAGYIKAFRDPCVFEDPETGRQHLLLAASLAGSRTDFDAAVGHATRRGTSERWEVQAPLLGADGVNNEMERPHVVWHQNRYYLFFSTQTRTFHPDVSGPTGLYGFVADSMDGQWRPLNGSGLVFCNPREEPYQCYSWLVLNDLRVISFVDMFALGGRDPDETAASDVGSTHFGGTPAPVVRIELDGDGACLVRDATKPGEA